MIKPGRSQAKIFLTAAVLLSTPVEAAHELEGRNIANGMTLYAEQCATCHGSELEGQPDWQRPNAGGVLPAPPHDETGHTWHHDNQLLFEDTKLGGEAALEGRGISGFKSGMPEFGSTLTEEEIWDILAFIRSTWPERIQNNQAARNRPFH